MINLEQDDIMKNWPSEYDKPVVSINCLVYNHASFVASCLDGFLAQKTTFPFEVVVHDDASTDESALIIKEYEKKFPKIIKPIYETENQYSKGTIDGKIIPFLIGKYVAFCEGDDYWCSSEKLQKQVDFLEANPDFSACTHNSIIQSMGLLRKRKAMFSIDDKVLDISSKDYKLYFSNRFHISSLVCKKDFFVNRPMFCFAQPNVGDLPLCIFLLFQGKIMRFGKTMSVYRCGTPGSWSRRVSSNSEKNLDNKRNAIKMLQMANEWSSFKFDDCFADYIDYLQYSILLIQGKYLEAKKKSNSKWWIRESATRKVLLTLKHFFLKKR